MSAANPATRPSRAPVAHVLDEYVASRTTHAAAIAALDSLAVRGAFRDDDSFIGFDYHEQQWIDTEEVVQAALALISA